MQRAINNNILLQGAVCLDGSPPGYYIRPGQGSGANKWIFHLARGGLCYDINDCYNRSFMWLGSSTFWDPIDPPPRNPFFGFLSDNSTINPDFYNWNTIYAMNCDGASFAGNMWVD